MNRMLETMHLSWNGLLAYLPALSGGIICFAATIIAANLLSGVVNRFSLRRTRDPLIANFIAKCVWTAIFIFGLVLTLGILGLGTISNKILAGAGLTTFIIGFALKDIGENFLAGIILAFSRPYKVGTLIEVSGIKGIVRDMTLRQTTVFSDKGKTVMIPNSVIIKNPLAKWKQDDDLNQEFSLNIDLSDLEKATEIIISTANSFPCVHKTETKKVNVTAESLNAEKVKVLVSFWFNASCFRKPDKETKSEVMIAVFRALSNASIRFSG